LIALDYVTSQPDEQAALAGLIVSAAPFQPTGVARPHLVALARMLSRLWPSFRLPLNLNGAALSRDPEVVESYAQDPLILREATARWGAEALAAVAKVKAGAGQIRLPLLMIHGTRDLVSLAAGSHDFFVRVDFPDKQIKLYSGAYHEPHNDLDHATVTSDLQQWIAQHL
jgi:alpha-beta hydrolase superfamily lysophospholipase